MWLGEWRSGRPWENAVAAVVWSLSVACDVAWPTMSQPPDVASSGGGHASHQGTGLTPGGGKFSAFTVDFAQSNPQLRGDAAGATAGIGASGGTGESTVLSAPFGTSTTCGDSIVGADEECDDGDDGRDACTQECRTRDQAPVITTLPTDRYLGVGRHTIAGRDDGFIAVFTEVRSAVDPTMVAATLFDIWGKAHHHIPLSDGGYPIDEANPVAAALPDGDFAVAWSDFGGDGSDLGVALRRVKIDGTIGPLSAANARSEFSQRNPDMIWAGEQLVVAWEDYANAETAPDLRYRLFDANLNPLSTDQTLAEGHQPEGAVSLAPFADGWAAAYREDAGGAFAGTGQETVVVRVGTKAFRIGPFPGGPMDDRPALGELDPTHLLVVVSVGTDPTQSGVRNVPRLRYAVVDTEGTTAPTLQPLEPQHCTNLTKDADEPAVDCGGADCAPCACSTTASPGTVTYCAACGCGVGEGDCTSNAHCKPGLVCRLDNGWRFERDPGLDLCFPQHCLDRVQSGDEAGPDWGGSCGPRQCPAVSQNGTAAHCTVSCPCPRGEGDCDYNDECQASLSCLPKGATFGIAGDVCVKTHCNDKQQNFDETGVDCGGVDCGPICP